MKGRYEVWMMMTVSAVMALLLVGSAAVAIGQREEKQISMGESSSIAAADDVKNKTIYFHNETGTVNNNADVDTMNTTMGTDQELTDWTYDEKIRLNWYLNPTLAGNLTLNGAATSYIWMDIKDASGGTNKIDDLGMELNEVYPNGSTETIASGNESYNNIRNVFTEYSVSTDNIEEYNVSAGSSLHVKIVLRTSGNFAKHVAYGDSEFPSRVEVETEDYIDVDTFNILDPEYNQPDNFSLEANETLIHFNASITDPFGGYDIRRVNLTLKGPEGVVFYREPMAKVIGNDTTYRSNYTYAWNYSGFPQGEYTAIVSAVDNTGYYYRYPDNPGDENYGGHLVESKPKNFWIGAERYYVHFKTIDSSNMTMEGARVSVYSSGGEEVTSNLTNEEGITNISVTDGNYIIRVYWEDIVVNETSYQVSDNVPYGEAVELNCTVYNSTYEVLDSKDDEVGNANLFISHPNGTLLRRVTDDDGLVEMEQTPIGNYTVRTEWLGREVEYTEHRLNSTENVTLEARIYYLQIETVDSEGQNVSEVHVSSRFNDTERLADAKLTDINGNTTMRLPGTEQGFGYDLAFQWRGLDVGQIKGKTLDETENLTIDLEIYHVDFNLTDSTGQDLENATLHIYNNKTEALANSGVSDEDGNVSMRLPRGLHHISVTWRGLEVNETQYEVSGDGSKNITCAVYHVDFTAVDSRDKPLSSSRITVSHPVVGLLNSETADQEDNVSMRLPGGFLDIEVDWRGVTVFSKKREIDSNDPVHLNAGVYYLQVEVKDDEDESLENSRVELYHNGSFLEEVVTDQSGMTGEMRLPGTEVEGKIEITVSWKGVQVYEDEDVDLVNNRTEEVKVDVYHVTFLAEDDLGEAIPRAKLRVTHNDGLLLSGRTNEEGTVFGKIPGAVNKVTLDWLGIRVYADDMLINASEERLLEVEDVHRLNYTVIDSRDEPLESASFDF